MTLAKEALDNILHPRKPQNATSVYFFENHQIEAHTHENIKTDSSENVFVLLCFYVCGCFVRAQYP